ncbi:uncharacterized protein LOC129588939 isoform X2 [Paramacrobiotus metropolitanus]|uniref:uncharacterized protein LOC129588939 isoform X2 n=1 Tax=Paramacrobiotus metropolitanus TaxID=2943436 RepID=UPI002445EF54|nr:uncharacterized protein LOC129588939 isoform X2 [Paramacrobiotus metropolitanus]
MNSLTKGKLTSVSKQEAQYVQEVCIKNFSHHVEDYVSGDLLNCIIYHARTNRTKEMAIYCSLLATTATLSAEKVMLQITENYKKQCPAINLLIVCKPGGGKSTALQDYCTDFLDLISQKKNKKFYDNPHTFAADEIAGTLATLTLSEENAASLMNKVWGGQSLNVSYKSAGSLKLPRSSSAFFGSLHPQPFCSLLKSWPAGNGLEDRLLVTAVDNVVTDIPECQEAKQCLPKPKVDLKEMFQKLHEYLEKHPGLLLTYSPEAFNFIGKISTDVKRMRILHNQKIANGEDSADRSDFISKLEDNIQKLSMDQHILDSSYHSMLTVKSINIPNIIALETVEKAFKFADISGDAFNEYENIRPATSSKASNFSLGLVPGQFVTCRIYNDTFGSRKAFVRLTEAEFSDAAQQMHEIGIGTMKPFLMSSGKEANVLYKCPPNKVDKQSVNTFGLMFTAYESAYNADFALPPSKRRELNETIEELKRQNPYNHPTAPQPHGTKRIVPDDEGYPPGLNIY